MFYFLHDLKDKWIKNNYKSVLLGTPYIEMYFDNNNNGGWKGRGGVLCPSPPAPHLSPKIKKNTVSLL